jgi:ribosome biogenesis protein UTP30
MTAKLAKSSDTTKSPRLEKAMATDTALDTDLLEKAVRAVLKFHEKASQVSPGKLALLGDERPVHVQFTLLRAPGNSNPKPFQIVVPHPFFKLADRDNQDQEDVEEAEICLIVKESSKPWCQEMIAKFPDHMGNVKKVLTLDSLRQKYTSYQQKRELLHKYNMFMADDRILPMLSKALGKAFIQTKRLPVPIDLTRQKALPFAIQKALSATYMTVNSGTCITIRAGHTGMDAMKIVENIMAITEKAVPKMPRKWSNVQLIGVKTADSTSLPVYNKTPEALREIAKLAGLKPDIGSGGAKNKSTDKSTEDSTEEGTKNKKKRGLKSPLLQALKKQKKEEDVEKKLDTQSSKKKVAAEKEAKGDASEPVTEPKSKRKASVAKESSKKKKQPDAEPASSKKKEKRDAEAVPQEETESPKKKQKVEKAKKNKANESNDQEDEGSKNDFIQAKKFKGSKQGYVFKMGRQGLGYYVDIKPRVDRDAMEAILRMGKNTSRRGGQKKNKYKGTRRF